LVANQGKYDGHHVVQVYGTASSGPYQGQSMLVGFATTQLQAGTTRQVDVRVEYLPLAHWDPNLKTRVLPDPSTIRLRVGAHASDRPVIPCLSLS